MSGSALHGSLLQLIYVFESEFEINIDLDDVVDIITVQDSVDYIRRKLKY